MLPVGSVRWEGDLSATHGSRSLSISCERCSDFGRDSFDERSPQASRNSARRSRPGLILQLNDSWAAEPKEPVAAQASRSYGKSKKCSNPRERNEKVTRYFISLSSIEVTRGNYWSDLAIWWNFLETLLKNNTTISGKTAKKHNRYLSSIL